MPNAHLGDALGEWTEPPQEEVPVVRRDVASLVLNHIVHDRSDHGIAGFALEVPEHNFGQGFDRDLRLCDG